MKKITYFIAALATLAACIKPENTLDTPKEDLMLNHVSSLNVTSAPVVKTSTDGTLQVVWNAGDQIVVFSNKLEEDTEQGTPFTITGSGGTITATFSGETVDCAEYGIAVYPYNDTYHMLQKADGGTASTLLPQTQVYVPNSIPNNALVMASRFDPKEGRLTFTPLAAVIELKLYGEVSVSSIKLTAYQNESSTVKCMSGQTKINFDDAGVPSSHIHTNGSAAVTLNCETPVQLNSSKSNATSFFIVVHGDASSVRFFL